VTAIPKRLWLVGSLAGVVSGMLGVGGGLVIGPALILLGMPLRRAAGTALALIPFIAATAVVAEVLLEPGNIYVGLAGAVFVGGIVGVKLGVIIDKTISSSLLHNLFLLLLIASAVSNIYAGLASPSPATVSQIIELYAQYYFYAAVFGVFAGVCAALFGVGGGVVVVPALIAAVNGLNFQEASAISLLAMVPTAAMAARNAYKKQRIDVVLAKSLAIVCLPAAVAGVALRNYSLNHNQLQLCFAAFLLYVALRILRRGPTPGT
jgi:uncharacterized membrane protein YfcA